MSRPRLIVCGGGPVGLAVAAACEGFETVVIEASARPPPPNDGGSFDLRVFALSAGTRALLKELGAWERLDARRIAVVRRMEVFGDHDSKLAFSPPAGEALAWIVEGDRLAAALEGAVAEREWIRVERARNAARFGAEAALAWVETDAGAGRAECDLLIGADGPDSRVRAAFGIAAETHSYAEAAVVANFDCEKPHEGIARQWFRHDGVLAWLPLPGDRISIVWSAPAATAEKLMAMDAPAFAARVRDAGAAALGALTPISPAARFPLRLIRVANPVLPGVALVGDAAHAVHPLAGQGMNLGFQDARCLARVLAGRTPLERPGDLAVLRRYARARREDVDAMQFMTDRLDQLFSARHPAVVAARNMGLNLVDRQGWAKRALARRAMR